LNRRCIRRFGRSSTGEEALKQHKRTVQQKVLIDIVNTSSRGFERWNQTLDEVPEKEKIANWLFGLEQELQVGLKILQYDLGVVLKKLESQ
jgi:hypothetical protein